MRLLRKEKNISLSELSKRSGLSISFLSNYENGKANISVASLKKISAALGVSISQLITDDDKRDVIFVKKDNRYVLPHHKTESGLALTEYLTRGPNTMMHLAITKLPPKSETGDYTSHIGEEFIYILHGTATVLLNDQRYVLEQGDMIYYSSEMLHKVCNEAEEEVEYLQTNTPPSF